MRTQRDVAANEGRGIVVAEDAAGDCMSHDRKRRVAHA